MPELTYYASFLAMGLMPVVIGTLNLMSIFMVEDVTEFAPFGMFSFFCQIVVLLVYISDFRAPFKKDYDWWVAERDGYWAIRRVAADLSQNTQELDNPFSKVFPLENLNEESRALLREKL